MYAFKISDDVHLQIYLTTHPSAKYSYFMDVLNEYMFLHHVYVNLCK